MMVHEISLEHPKRRSLRCCYESQPMHHSGFPEFTDLGNRISTCCVTGVRISG